MVLRTLPKMRPQASSKPPPRGGGDELKVKIEGLRVGPHVTLLPSQRGSGMGNKPPDSESLGSER